jgi:hypothetical protein
MNDMNIKKNYLSLCLFIIVGVTLVTPLAAQQYSIKDKWNIKIGYSGYPCLGQSMGDENAISPTIHANINYGILNFLEVGGYLGYTSIITTSAPTGGNFVGTGKANVLFYGIKSNVHLLPFFLKSEKFRFDLYVSGKCGGFYRSTSENESPVRGHTIDYGIFAGAAFYPGEHWGIFGEYGIGNYSNYLVGLSFKF